MRFPQAPILLFALSAMALMLDSCSPSLKRKPENIAPLFGSNLCPNPSFEETDMLGHPAGWTLSPPNVSNICLSVADDGCVGQHCMMIEKTENMPAADSIHPRVWSPVIPVEEGWYLLSFWTKRDFPTNKPPWNVIYVNHHPGTNYHGARLSAIYYYPGTMVTGQWQHAFLLFRQRPGQKGIQLQLDGNNMSGKLRLDGLQVRKLIAHNAGEALSSNYVFDGYGADKVHDSDAKNGFAWQVSEGKNPPGSKIMGGTRHSEIPGLYVAAYRFKQKTPGEHGKQCILISMSGGGGQTIEHVLPEDFSANGKYQDFPVYFFYPFGGGTFYTWGWEGKGSYAFDHLALDLVRPLSRREAWNCLYEGVDPDIIQPAPEQEHAGFNVWIACGLYTELYGIYQALDANRLKYHQSAFEGRKGLLPAPVSFEGLRLVVLSDVPSKLLAPIQQYRLMQFVNKGGGLIVLGGPYGYGYGGMRGGFLEEILPVEIEKPFDLIRIDPSSQTVKASWKKMGQCTWAHQVKVRKGCQVVMKAGNIPIVVKGNYGKGRVVAVLGTVLGEPETPFWTTDAWKKELNNLARWTSGL